MNAFGQILSSTQAGVTTTFSYDALGNKISATDGNGNTTHYAYDAQGRLIEETSPKVRVVTDVEQGLMSTQAIITRHQYDQLGNKTQTIVGANSDQPRVTEFRYNAQGQLIQQRQNAHQVDGQPRPQVAMVNRQYDAVGNLIRETDANGQATTFYYNARNQLIAQVDGDGVLKTF
ncbi:RHS repeat domain-containing protein, partial [Zooshikella harenae]